MVPDLGDEAYWKSQRLRVSVDDNIFHGGPPGDFRVMELSPEPRAWTAKSKDLVKLEEQGMARVKLSSGDMFTYRRLNNEVHTARQRAMEALHAYTYASNPEHVEIWMSEIQRCAQKMRELCQEQEVFMVGLEEKYKFSRRGSIVLDLYTDEIGIHKDS